MKPAAAAAPPAACMPLAAPAGFELWRIDLAQPLSRDDLALLDEHERARAERFAFDASKQRYRAAHVALRRLLAAPLDADPAALRFDFGAQGKPRLAGPADAPAFNLSDSGDVALIAVAPGGEIGVDLELLRPIDDAAELAAQHFCRREAEALAAAGSRQRDRLFLRIWARKEACLKAIGSGLSIAAGSFDGGRLDPGDAPAPQWTRVTIPTPDGVLAVEATEVDAGPGCVAALARQVRARRA
ncbi:MAG TPA: 4'-phosphopantetheinyl transferase superfamily protein [Methylibium sp.]|uniref:4'-phosphopantetheinyl transferase family protein n=1 Tax=Methylibium sp. TaxID=2067992 RepID=UPI002DBA4EED|nr:4'-phosphopantetheinyl transferase superfamily protein [Methylibium sp.]HEU4459258.1 4'-phosphopantetheinyl transferase superfamily protein [Methylibium sp.]